MTELTLVRLTLFADETLNDGIKLKVIDAATHKHILAVKVETELSLRSAKFLAWSGTGHNHLDILPASRCAAAARRAAAEAARRFSGTLRYRIAGLFLIIAMGTTHAADTVADHGSAG